MKIHVRAAPARRKPQNGDQKMIKGVLHERISTRILMRGWNEEKGEGCYYLAWDHTGGRQRHEWVPVADLVGHSPYKRRYYPELDGSSRDITR
ncbi:hypothetical protein VU643_22320 [Klebsiella aerogenes]|uniref:hypothetical protein n=1 Tax=Klebsiella aerogenes TaxID=548 RepID=UPI003CF910B6